MTAISTRPTPVQSRPPFDSERVRAQFPILGAMVRGKPLVYLDNAATTQKPQCVIDAITRYYTQENANVHRGIHYLSQKATDRYEEARHKINAFLGTSVGCETIFTRGATEAINLVAHSFGRSWVNAGDEILISHMEHHSNIVPWQLLCEEREAKLRVVPINDAGELIMEEYDRLLNERTRLVAVTHVSNALGTVNPVRDICRKARDQGAASLVDGAQSAPHMPIDMHDIGADFFVCSGHKMYAPTGIGVLYGRAAWLEQMRPYQGGGDMILSVSFEKTVFAELPHKFEAGTPNIEGVIALGAAVEFLEKSGMENIAAYEHELLTHATESLSVIEGLHIIGTAGKKGGILSFIMDGVHPHDIGQLLDEEGIAIRTGHHCAEPTMKRYGIPATARASLALYNTREEIDALARALTRIRDMFA